MTEATLEADLSALDFEPDILCESGLERDAGKPEHPAQWLIVLGCGCDLAYCNAATDRVISRAAWKGLGTCPKCEKITPLLRIEPIK